MQPDHYESWLAKQAAMGRTVPVTTAPYYAPQVVQYGEPGKGKTAIVETDTFMGIPLDELLSNG